MLLESALLLGGALVGELCRANKSMKIDEAALRKNARAATKIAEAENKLKLKQDKTFAILAINAKRKHGILTCHINLFKEQYEILRKLNFEKGRGIEELENFNEIKNKLIHYVSLPSVSSGKIMTDSQLLISYVLKGGIGGLMIQESEMNSKLASRNMAQANTVEAQINSICIALDGLAQHVEIVTELLERLGMLYIKSIKHMSEIIKANGKDASKYTKRDIDDINTCVAMTKVIYRIINTPLVDANGEIEKESYIVIQNGQNYLDSISKNV